MSDLVLRHLEVLKLIPRNPGSAKTTAEIAESLEALGFKISLRSVQRDLEKLSAVFPITCIPNGKSNAWYYVLRDGQHVMIPGIDHHTALTFKLAERHLQPLIPQQLKSFLQPYFHEADKILQQHPSKLKKWLNKTSAISLGLQQRAPSIDADVWDVLSRAILDEQQCEVRYQSHRAEAPKTYNISPLGIVIRGPVTYLLAVYDGYSDIRQMAMHRFFSARSIPADADIPEDFNLDIYIREGHFGILYDETPVPIVLSAQPGIARLLREAPLSEDQVIEESETGVFRISATLPESWDLYRWLLSHGMDIRIESPEYIRCQYLDYLKQALSQYES